MSFCQFAYLCIIDNNGLSVSFLFILFTFQVNGDKYYLDGLMKIQKSVIDSLKGMNAQYITSLKECDYRFVSLLLINIFKKDELAAGCVKLESRSKSKEEGHQTSISSTPYKQLEERKIDFIKGKKNINNHTDK